MKTSTPLRAFATLGALLALAGCGDSTDLEPLDDSLVADAAMLAADATLEEVRLWSQPLDFAAAPAAVPDRFHTRDGPGAPGGHGGFTGELSGTRSVTFFDAEGVEQASFDPLTTESIHILHEVEGTIERGSFTAEIARDRDMTVSGLSGEESERTWNGSGSSELLRSGVLEDGTERTHSAVGTFAFEDVVVPIPGTEPRYPLSGTITRSMTMTRTTGEGTRTRSVAIVITFDGSEIATAVVNGEVVEIDLSTRDGMRPLRRRPG